MKNKMGSREEQRQRKIDEFIDNWSWERVFRYWNDCLQDFSIELDSLFQVVKLHDPATPYERPPEIAWWPAKSIQAKHLACQKHFDNYPGTLGSTHSDAKASSEGEATTLRYLWENRSNAEIVAAILLVASLFPRMQSARRHYPENWPPFPAVETLADWAYAHWLGVGRHRPWHYSCTTVLPYISEDYIYKIDSMHALIRYLAEEHAALLINFRPVVVEFAPERDPFVAHALNQQYKAEQQRHAEWMSQQKAEQEAEKQRVKALRLKHPRYGEWNSISADELEKLIWSKATSQLATEFGISDVAIGKRCKALGIMKPPPGFWNKVAAGKIPHPEGRPSMKKASKSRPELTIVQPLPHIDEPKH